jgi:cation diffusion facilitator family transporter
MANSSDTDNLKYGSRMALFGIAEIVLLALFKATLGYMTGIVVLIADALSSGADLLTLFASYVGLKISQRPADKNFKYGYYKAETFAAFITSLAIIYFGLEILMESVGRITTMEPSQNQYLAVISVAVSTVVTLHLARFLQKTGKKINSIALIDTGKEKKMDLLMQVAVLIGVGASYYRIPYLEGIIGIVISGMTLKVGLETAKESLFFLLDYFNDPDMLDKVKKIIRAKSHIVKSIKDIRMRRSGTIIFGEAFLEIDPYAQTKDLRNDLNNMQEEIKRSSPYLKDFLLFVTVPRPSTIKVALPVKEDKGLQSKLAHLYEDTKAYIFVNVKKDRIVSYYGRNFNYKPDDFSAILRFLEGEKVNVVINNDMHSLIYYQLRRLHNVEVYPNFSNVKDVENTVKLLLIDT